MPLKQTNSTRILTRFPIWNVFFQSIQEFIPLYDSNTLIIDDFAKVWEKPENVLEVPRYAFWPDNDSDIKNYNAPGVDPWAAIELQKKDADLTLRNIDTILSVIISTNFAILFISLGKDRFVLLNLILGLKKVGVKSAPVASMQIAMPKIRNSNFRGVDCVVFENFREQINSQKSSDLDVMRFQTLKLA